MMASAQPRTVEAPRRTGPPPERVRVSDDLRATGRPRDARIGLVHDYLLVLRGAERTFATIADAWPEASIYTLLYDEEGTQGRFAGRRVRTSPLQRLGARQETFRRLLPLFPLAASRLPVQDHEVVISSSSAFAHGVRPARDAVHVCYCYTPFRYAWHERRRALREVPAVARPVLATLLAGVRQWDRGVAGRVTHLVACSRIAQQRIARFWGRSAEIVHPPVDVDRFTPAEPEDFFLFVGEIVRHKRVELALEAARRARVRLVVVGSGPEHERLRFQYRDVGDFRGRVDDDELASLYGRARALVMPNVEEFGIAAVEAQAAGRPVAAAAAGGALETVRTGETGVLVAPDDVNQLAGALGRVRWEEFDPDPIRAHARRFSVASFQQRLRDLVAMWTA
jgi:glycosyltransferase involved in cell wall biosynthesis